MQLQGKGAPLHGVQKKQGDASKLPLWGALRGGRAWAWLLSIQGDGGQVGFLPGHRFEVQQVNASARG